MTVTLTFATLARALAAWDMLAAQGAHLITLDMRGALTLWVRL